MISEDIAGEVTDRRISWADVSEFDSGGSSIVDGDVSEFDSG